MTTARDFIRFAPGLQKPKALAIDAERALADAMVAGDAAAHHRLWEVALPLVPYCESKLRKSGYLAHVAHADPDMLQEGYLCIGPALKRWDPSGGRMSSFLVPRIRGAMLDWAAEAFKAGIASKHTACTVLDMEEIIVDGEFEPKDEPGLHAAASGFSRMDMLTYDGIYGPSGLDHASANPNALSVERVQEVDDLLRLLYTLPTELSETIRLAYGVGCAQLSAQEIADMSGLSVRTVYRHIEDGVAQMRQKWRDYK